ncbi:MAG: hypothetical protein JW940_05770 [Polyangiaceae bacterium]|nr:hypothetical protein [Polyangiaceae bacterium]
MKTLWKLCFVGGSLSTVVGLGCTGGGDDTTAAEGSVAVVEGAEVRKSVVAAEGATLKASTGHLLTIPREALDADTTIDLRPLDVEQLEGQDLLGGVELRPDGLEFSSAATLTVPLAVDLPSGTELAVFEDPSGRSSFYPTGGTFVVDGSGLAASGPIYGFCSQLVGKTCHAGTRDQILRAWEKGHVRSREDVVKETGLSKAELEKCELAADPIQKLLASYFTEVAEVKPGKSVPDPVMDEIKLAVTKGRQVVLLFGQQLSRQGGAWAGVKHSAVVVDDGNELVVRNQLMLSNEQMLNRLKLAGHEPLIDKPLKDIDATEGMRDVRHGELWSLLVDGKPKLNRKNKPCVWEHLVVYVEQSGEAPEPEAVSLGQYVDRCDSDWLWSVCDPFCNASLSVRGATVAAIDGECQYELDLELENGSEWVHVIYHTADGWDTFILNAGDEPVKVTTTAGIDRIGAFDPNPDASAGQHCDSRWHETSSEFDNSTAPETALEDLGYGHSEQLLDPAACQLGSTP